MRVRWSWLHTAVAASAVLCILGVFYSLEAPLAGAVAAIVSILPLAATRLTRRHGGCVAYTLMVLPVWVTFVFLFFLAFAYDAKQPMSTIIGVFCACIFWFVHASMVGALYVRFTEAYDKDVISTGEKWAVSLTALLPLVLICGGYVFIWVEALISAIQAGK